jgi:hypothetical protein
MGKRIVILSDGTGNSPKKVWRTNVWRVFESLDLEGTGQVAYYDNGMEASQCGLKFKEPPKSDPHSLRQIESKQDIDGQLYDSRSGLAAYYRYGPRNLSEMLSGMA